MRKTNVVQLAHDWLPQMAFESEMLLDGGKEVVAVSAVCLDADLGLAHAETFYTAEHDPEGIDLARAIADTAAGFAVTTIGGEVTHDDIATGGIYSKLKSVVTRGWVVTSAEIEAQAKFAFLLLGEDKGADAFEVAMTAQAFGKTDEQLDWQLPDAAYVLAQTLLDPYVPEAGA